MIYTMLKSCFNNTELTFLNYRDFKHFLEEAFKEDLREALCEEIIRGDNKPHVNKALHQAFMKRSKLKNKAYKTKDPTDIRNYKKQRNYVVNLSKVAKFKYFSKYESSDSKPFWVNCKPYFTNKHSKPEWKFSKNGELILRN